MKSEKLNKFSERLKELRNERNMTRQALADELHISVRLVGYWENGQRECSLDMLIKLAKILDSDVNYLIGYCD